MELLDVVSGEFGLVSGCETGHDAAVPYVDYFEGMMSLGPYRVPDAGRNMQQMLDEVPERVAKFQTGSYYRLPLWELVYHDCVVAQWYWGDYNNKLPALWDRRDLWNALYGTPPMFMFNREGLERSTRRASSQSYKASAAVVARLRLQRDARPPLADGRPHGAADAVRERRDGDGQLRRAALRPARRRRAGADGQAGRGITEPGAMR